MNLTKDSSGTFYSLTERNGIPIVFIHGVGLNHTIWDPQINAFNNTIIVYDILGHGQTELKKDNISFDDFGDQLFNLLDELNVEKIHLVGFSIGSLIARNFAVRFSNRLESLTLLCSVYKRNKKQQNIVKDRYELVKKSRKLSKQALKRWFTDKYLEENPKAYKKITEILNQNKMENFLKVYNLFVNHEDKEQLKEINTKTLIMTGENDIGSTPEMSKNLSQVIKESKLHIVPNGKHLCSIECAYDVNTAIKNHING